MKEHRILLVSTGGTIAGRVANSKRDRGNEPCDARSFSKLISSTVEYLADYFDVRVVVEQDTFLDIDSSDIEPKHWEGLAQRIYDHYDEFDSFVVTHGTNTLGYTCAALSFALVNARKPIVLTGSQVPIELPGSDAKANLENAFRVASWPHRRISGVLCVFGSHIITGTRAKKTTEFDYDAFKSFGTSSIGRIGRIIDISRRNLDRHNSYLETTRYSAASSRASLRLENHFDARLVSLTEFPGMDYETLLHLQQSQGIRAFIIRAFGAGDISTSALQVLRKLKAQEVPVVVTTQAPKGNANLQVNEPGWLLKREGLAIPAYDMSIEAQTTKLMWLLAKRNRGEINFTQLREAMIDDMHGEINVIWETEQ